jgi:cell division protein FtsZ
MALDFMKPDLKELKPRITVIGVGGAGGNAVNNMISTGLQGVDFVVANTDAQALSGSSAEQRLQLGLKITQGLGAGMRPEIGRAAAEEALDQIETSLEGTHMCFIAAGMGGGTGTGAAPIVAKAARERGILTVAVVTKPFDFEGQRRMRLADDGIEELQKHVDTLIIIPNQNLFRIADRSTTMKDAFNLADNVLHSGVRSITDLMVMPGLINLDFADVRTVMSEMGKAMMGTGEAIGENRALEAAEKAIANPLLDEVSLRGAKGVIINVTGGYDVTLFEVDEAANHIRSMVDADANIIVGAAFNEDMEGKLRVSVVATGIESHQTVAARPQATRPTTSPFGGVANTMGSVPPQSLRPIIAPQPEQSRPEAVPEAVYADVGPEDEPLALEDSMRAPQPEPITDLNMRSQLRENVVALPTAPLVETFERSYTPAPAQPKVAESRTPLTEPVRSGSLFERLTNFGGPARVERKDKEAEVRSEASNSEDPFAIPTFLRRQGN